MAVAIVSELLKFSLGWRILGSAVVALVVILLLSRAMRGQCIRDIAHIEVKKIEFDGPILVVDGVSMMNVGLEAARKRYVECGLGAAIIPKDANAKATLANIGQMQAIAHDVSSMIGVYMDVGTRIYSVGRRDLTLEN